MPAREILCAVIFGVLFLSADRSLAQTTEATTQQSLRDQQTAAGYFWVRNLDVFVGSVNEDVVVASFISNLMSDPILKQKGLVPKEAPSVTWALLNRGDDRFVQLSISLPRDEPIHPEALLTNAAPILQQALTAAQDAPLEAAAQAYGEALDTRSQIGQAIRSLEQKVRGVIADASPETMHVLSAKIDEAAFSTTIDDAARQARMAAMEKEISALAHQAEAQANDDLILKSLQDVLDLKQNRLEQLEAVVRSGLAAVDDRDKAQVEVAESKVKILERREALMQNAGGESLSALKAELARLQIDAAESKARADALAAAHLKLTDVASPLDELQVQKARLAEAESEVQQRKQAQEDLRARARSHAPVVVSRVADF